MKKRTRLGAFFCALGLIFSLLAGCSGGGEPLPPSQAHEPEEPMAREDSIIIATMSEPPSLSPTGHSSIAGDYMNLLTYSTLFRLDMEMNPQPHLWWRNMRR